MFCLEVCILNCILNNLFRSVEIRQTKDEGEPSTSAENEGEKNAEDVARCVPEDQTGCT